MLPICHSIDVHKHAFTQAMGKTLLEVINGDLPVPTNFGNWQGSEFAPMPINDLSRPISGHYGILHSINHVANFSNVRLQCRNYYPPQGGMGWHTDSSNGNSFRVYVYYSLYDGNVFQYRDDIFEEHSGLGGYVFSIGQNCWHQVYAKWPRFVCGYEINESLANEIIDCSSYLQTEKERAS
jgi:hypothetical protein